MAILTPDRIRQENGVTVKEKIIPDSARATRNVASHCKMGQLMKPCRLMRAAGVTIHNTADIDQAPGTTDAEQYTRATWPNCNMGGVVVHYYVDAEEVWQMLREDEQGWHAADGAGPGNTTTIAIEVIMTGDGGSEDRRAEENAARLAASILHRHHLGIDRLHTHNHWMNLPDQIVWGKSKNCPIYLLPHWERFKDRVGELLRELAGREEAEPEPSKLWHVQCGAFRSIDNAKALENELRNKGLPTYLVMAGGLLKVQVGAFAQKANAEAMAERVKALGYKTFLTDKAGKPATGAIVNPAAIEVGSKVKVHNNTRSYTGGKLASWVYGETFDVLENKGGRVVIGRGEKVTAAVHLYDVYSV